MVKLKHLFARFDALTARERALVFVTILVATVALWYLLLLEPTLRAERAAVGELAALRERIMTAEQAIAEQVRAFPDRGASTASRLETLRRRAESVERALEEHVGELIDPAEMARVLEEVLERQRDLELTRMRNLGAEPVLADEDADEGAATLYQHGLELTLEGDYLACLAYLRDLEALPWRLYWRALEIDAGEYPRSRIRIEVSTLSFEEDWIGV